MRATAVAPANIAFIKYWGKSNAALNLPLNDSVSMNLSAAHTTTTVEFIPDLAKDEVRINGEPAIGREQERVSRHLDRIASYLSVDRVRAKVESKNSFPTASGIASSASGFAALTLAAAVALGKQLSEKEISILARQGSGSACRSIPGGFVKWQKGSNNEDSFAFSLYPADYWKLHDFIVIFDQGKKKILSSEGHELAATSPLLPSRLAYLPNMTREIEQALVDKDFTKLGSITEADTMSMHAIMLTSQQALLYWEPETVVLMRQVYEWRQSGLEVYFTIDAGSSVHVICQENDALELQEKLSFFAGAKQIIVNVPSGGTRLKIG